MTHDLRTAQTDSGLVPVVDSAIGRCIGYKERDAVHTDGDFHLGVQAYIVRENENGRIEVLVQKRSLRVDISKGRHDQSLATQVLAKDSGDIKAALIRGLLEELDIQKDEVEVTAVGGAAEFRIYKKYAEDSALYNREIISLYFVKVRPRTIRSVNPKVESLEWMEWDRFVRRVKEHPEDFAKTVRFYVMSPSMLDETEKALKCFIRGENIVPIFGISKSYYYGYPGRYDLFMLVYRDQSAQMQVYDYTEHTFTRIDDIQSFDAYEGRERTSVAIRITKNDGENLLWENGALEPTGLRADRASVSLLKRIERSLGTEMAGLKAQIRSRDDALLLEALRQKLGYQLMSLRSRVQAGEMVFFDELPADENEAFALRKPAERVTLIAVPGTFDPPHFAHVELLLDALIHESEKARGLKTAYGLFFAPLGERALGPAGEPWKVSKTSAQDRHRMCGSVSEIFYPLIQTSRIGLIHESDFGTANTLRIMNSFHHAVPAGQLRFVVAGGTDTYRRWGANMRAVIAGEKHHYPDATVSVLIRDSWMDPLEPDLREAMAEPFTLLSGHYSLPIRSTHIRTGELNLIAEPVRRYILASELYEPARVAAVD